MVGGESYQPPSQVSLGKWIHPIPLPFLELELGRQGLQRMETHFLRTGYEGGEMFPEGHF